MSNRPKNPPQDQDEMALAVRGEKRSKVYKAEAAEFNDARISALVDSMAEGLENQINPRARVPLSDTERIKEISVQYVRTCAENSTFPTMRGLASAIGCSRQSLYDYIKRHPDTELSDWLMEFSDGCGETLMQAAISGYTSPVPSIFTAKARYQWRDVVAVEQVQHDPLGPYTGADIDEIAERYRRDFSELPDD